MTFLIQVLKRLTHTKAIDETSGQFEMSFFESIYRIVYITGLSVAEKSVGYFIYSSIVRLLKTLLVCSELWYLFYVTWSMDAVIDSTNILIIQFSSFYKYKNMITHRKIYKALASSMESPNFDISTDARKDLVDIWVKRNNSYIVYLLILGTCTLTFWYGYPLMDDIEYNLMVAVYFPFDYMNPSIYPIVYVMVIVMFSYMSYFVMITDILMLTYLMQLLCQFMVLKDCFSNILKECSEDFKGYTENQMFKDERFRKKYSDRLRNLINQHSNTLELRNILSGPMLGHLAMSTILICSIGCQIVLTISVNLTKCLMSLLYLGYNMIILYVLCSWCEEVTIQNEGIGTALYCSGWERGLATIPGVRSSLLLILIRANKPLVLTAGGMYDLSLASYANFRRLVVKRRLGNVLYAVGMICCHKIHNYVCVIQGWDNTAAPARKVNLEKLTRGYDQPFYHVIAADNSERYVAEENLVALADPTRLKHIEEFVGKQFTHFDGFSYLLSAEKMREYPEEVLIVNEYRHRFHKLLID